MSKYSLKIKEKAVYLREKGYSIKEIAKILKISLSTSSIWLRNLELNKKAIKRLERRKLLGYYKLAKTWDKKRKENNEKNLKFATEIINNHVFTNDLLIIYAALLFWCEGSKCEPSTLKFTNSDPKLIFTFLQLIRKSSDIQEFKFRVRLHLHDYHDENEQKLFWSKLTNIPLEQFTKVYLKPHTKKRERPDYQGCATIIYNDVNVLRKLKSVFQLFSEKIMGI